MNRFRSFNLNFVSKPSVPDFGGLDLFKNFIQQAKLDFSIQARDNNIPLPKGCFALWDHPELVKHLLQMFVP